MIIGKLLFESNNISVQCYNNFIDFIYLKTELKTEYRILCNLKKNIAPFYPPHLKWMTIYTICTSTFAYTRIGILLLKLLWKM